METKILVDVVCIHCESIIHIQKNKMQEQCKLVCPGCKKPLHLLFNLMQDPQTYAFLSVSQYSKDKDANLLNKEVHRNEKADKIPKDKTIYKKDRKKAEIFEEEIPGEENPDILDKKKQKNLQLKKPLYLVRKKLLGFATEKYRLTGSKTIIGRADEDEPSDIALSGDDTISRRSICIEVKADEYGFDYILKVLNASNPVRVNGKIIKLGEKIYLDLGDIITIGHTNLKFDDQ